MFFLCRAKFMIVSWNPWSLISWRGRAGCWLRWGQQAQGRHIRCLALQGNLAWFLLRFDRFSIKVVELELLQKHKGNWMWSWHVSVLNRMIAIGFDFSTAVLINNYWVPSLRILLRFLLTYPLNKQGTYHRFATFNVPMTLVGLKLWPKSP